MSYRRRGALYLVHFSQPYKHARHYLGIAFPDDPARANPLILAEVQAALQTRITRRYLTAAQAAGVAHRIREHRAGRGARLLAVISEAGIEFTVVRVWAGATEGAEKYLKDLNHRKRLCPVCHPGTTAGTVIKPKRYRRRRARKVPAALAA